MTKFALLPLVLAGCSTTVLGVSAPEYNSPDEVEDQTVVVQQSTVLLDETPGLLDIQVGTDQVIVETDGTPVSVEVGSVIVGQLDGGYLRTVTEVVEQGDLVILRTGSADLSDAILHGRYSATADVDDRAAHTWDLGGRVLYNGDVWSGQQGDYVNVDLFVADGSTITIDPQFDFDIDLFNGNWIDASFTGLVELDHEVDVVAVVDGAYDMSFENRVLSRTIPFVFELGPVPVIGTANIDIIVGFSGDFDGVGTSRLHTESSSWAMVDAGYNDDGWYFDSDGEMTGDMGFVDTEFDQEVTTRAWVRAELNVELYGSAGADVTIEPWITANTCMPAGIDVDGGVEGTHRYYFEAFGWNAFDSGVQTFDFGPWDIYELECDSSI